MTMTLQEAISEVKRGEPLELLNTQAWAAYEVIITAVASGALIPCTDAEMAIALAYQRAGDRVNTYFREQHLPLKERSHGANLGVAAAILALAPAEPLAEVARLLEMQTDREADHERQLAEARTDAEMAVAVAYQRAAAWCQDRAEQITDTVLPGPPEQSRQRESMEAALTQARYAILALAPAVALAEVKRMRAELREARMKSLSDLEQAQDALGAQKAAEAEVARLKEALTVYAEPCDASDTTACGYEGNMCCRTARAALQPTQGDAG